MFEMCPPNTFKQQKSKFKKEILYFLICGHCANIMLCNQVDLNIK